MANALINTLRNVLTRQVTSGTSILEIEVARAAEEACRKKGINVSREQLKLQLTQKQHTDVRNALIHLTNKANIIKSQTAHIISLMLREDPQFEKINKMARDTVHLLMEKQKKFVKETLPLYEEYKKQLAHIQHERKNGNLLYTTAIEAKIENIQDEIKTDISEMKELYTKGQYQTQIVYGFEKISLNTSQLSTRELLSLSSAELFKSLDSVHKTIGSYIEQNSTYVKDMIEFKP